MAKAKAGDFRGLRSERLSAIQRRLTFIKRELGNQ
jgi:hypothetical protein